MITIYYKETQQKQRKTHFRESNIVIGIVSFNIDKNCGYWQMIYLLSKFLIIA